MASLLNNLSVERYASGVLTVPEAMDHIGNLGRARGSRDFIQSLTAAGGLACLVMRTDPAP